MKYLEIISEYSDKKVPELAKMSQKELVDDVILPLWVGPTGQRSRGWRIPDSFMAFMAIYGNYCYEKDRITGAVLYEIAMQRISCGAVMHEHRKVVIDEFLPNRYLQYSVGCDQKGLMSPACWSFLRDQMKNLLLYPETKEHATAILLGVLDHIDRNGNLLNGFSLNYERDGVPEPRDLWAWAVKTALPRNLWPWNTEYLVDEISLPPEVVAKHFSRPDYWRHYLWYWAKCWPNMSSEDKKRFFRAIGVSGWWKKHIVKKEIKRYAKEMAL